MRPRSKPPPSASSRGVRNGSRSLRSLRRLRRSRTMSAKQAGMQARRHARALRAMAQHHLSQSRMRASARRLPKALAPCLGTSVHWDFFACLAREPRQIGFSEDQFLKTWQFGWAKSCSFGR
ncbi:unnamed protein product [Effrenium voratum]|nr:unnamed protein product [Effrenium voratum]